MSSSEDAPNDPELPSILGRALGLREGLSLKARTRPGSWTPLSMLEPRGSGTRFLVVRADGAPLRTQRLALIRILPLDLRRAAAGQSLRRWSLEWSDMTSSTPHGSGLLRPAWDIVLPAQHPPVLPPLYFCAEKKALIPVICPDCEGPGPVPASRSDEICEHCGSLARRGEAQAGPRQGNRQPLDLLREHVHLMPQGGPSTAADASAAPFCLSCDKRDRCYPAEGTEPGSPTAADFLVSISEVPWGGIAVEPFHLPIGAWFQLLGGAPWTKLRADLEQSLPPLLLEDVDRFFREDRRFLTGPEAPKAFSFESHLLKLEALRQILQALRHLAVERRHPRSRVSPGVVWVRLEPSDSLRSALWSASVQLIDPVPGDPTKPDGVSGSEDRKLFIPPGCAEAEAWIEGTCMLRSTHPEPGQQVLTRLDFVPSQPMSKPPVKGDLVELAMLAEDSPSGESLIEAKVEIGHPEMCRVYLLGDASTTEGNVGRLLRGHAGSTIRLRIARDHSLVDDLYAAGTLWISALLAEPSNFKRAARFREDLTPKLRDTRPGGGDTLVQQSLKAAVASHLFNVSDGGTVAASATGAKTIVAPLNSELLAKSVALGMRLCGAVPAGYPFQNHEPTDRDEKQAVYDTLLSIVIELSREVRERLMGAGDLDTDILAALSEYAKERSARKNLEKNRRKTMWTRSRREER